MAVGLEQRRHLNEAGIIGFIAADNLESLHHRVDGSAVQRQRYLVFRIAEVTLHILAQQKLCGITLLEIDSIMRYLLACELSQPLRY